MHTQYKVLGLFSTYNVFGQLYYFMTLHKAALEQKNQQHMCMLL